MTIHKLLTIRNFQNYNSTGRIKYIVIHYVGATGGAEDNCKYFYKEYRGASAHYFVGHKGEVWQCVDDADIAWHCGGGFQGSGGHTFYQKCTNTNSIGIELCCKKDKNGNWYFEQATLDAAIALVKELMAKYNVPLSNVIRHYDVTGKICPEPFVRNTNAWNDFKNKVANKATVNNSVQNNSSTIKSSYLVKINCSVLNVRAGAGTGYKVNTTVKRNEVYTIVETKNNWGKLKSGAGWICLDYTKRV